ncbi:MAG: hypothetical protein S4CHLAM102_01970 [Chlamydiia bacterium]|nr:hypothetical protein [Chlamydiia bacterium]
MAGKKSVAIHNGTFHADEVSACALLIHFGLVEQGRIVRTRDAQRIAECEFVCDVGGEYDSKRRLFDHHQSSYEGEMSSAGMVLLFLRDEGVIDDPLYEHLRGHWIYGVDQIDNGLFTPLYGFATYSMIISSFVPPDPEASSDEVDRCFDLALNFARDFLARMIGRYEYIESCREVVARAMSEGERVLVFERNIPWLELFFDMGGEEHPAEFLIMPAHEGQWKLRGIPPSLTERMAVRTPLPEEWAGKMGAELEEASGIPGAIFCHKGRFISMWRDREAVEKALKKVLDE